MMVLILLLLAALVYQVLALVCLGRFFQQATPLPLSEGAPGITVFKPVKGLDQETRECLESFLSQDYDPYQVIFGVAAADDPVATLLEELRRNAPEGRVEVRLCPKNLGHNPKVSTLRQLEPYARFDLMVVADQDVKVGPDFLGRVAGAFRDPAVGLVSCPYRAGRSKSLGSVLEALTISADFIPSVAAAQGLEGIRFALGAAMAFTRMALDRIGGFAPLADYLADDYQLGRRIHEAGFTVSLIPYVVETVNPRMSLGAYLAHQRRWTRTYRVCRPRGYLAYGVTHALVVSLLLGLISGGASWAWGLVAAALALRVGVAWFSEVLCLKGTLPLAALLLVPLKDLLSFGLWLSSFLGNEVDWQGRRYGLTPEGLLSPLQK
jgi:ceramide glucosyltransferase